MAAPMTAAQFAAVLRAEGCTVVEVGSWETHNRNHMGSWGPVHGVMIHHTVTSGSARTVEICRTGYTQLPGPLCHGVITKDGRVHLVGYGRANHAGSGDPDVLTAVINETALPADNEATTDGNRHFYGFECENLGDGVDPWPDAQLLAIERVSAAICRHHGWGAGSVIGHLEWQPGKVDPRGFSMQTMRGRVAARLDGNQQEEEMALSADDKAWIEGAIKRLAPVAVLTTDGIIDNPVKGSDNTHISLETSVRNIETVARRTEARVIGLGAPSISDAQVAALASALAAHPALADLIAEKVATKIAARLAS